MATVFLRDAAATAAIFGFFGSAWFGWAQEHPPKSWRRWLLAGSVVSLVTMVAGGLLVWRRWGDGTAFDEDTSITFGVVVGIELVLAGVGAAVLGARGRRDIVPVWIALVVGVHLFPVAVIIGYPAIHGVGALVTIAALAAIPLARSRSLPVSAMNGLCVGTALLAGALFSVVTAL
ncbi:MAG: hypothetical protein GEV28_31755 [Actinophytocola sp.]|uniref:hypothetical protein n=1 Tax=Actinophytocola sp. TaxID=1872138 RepID=UPI00132811F3|nr:hypothetical protein [Actinophytocola sp.]MPZ84714.1 hypothetical protein [Actinophytocola sp.]